MVGCGGSVCIICDRVYRFVGDVQIPVHGASHGHLAIGCAWLLSAEARRLRICCTTHAGGFNCSSPRLSVWPGCSTSSGTGWLLFIVCNFLVCRVHIIASECCWWRSRVQVDFFVGHPACNMRLQGDTVGALRRKVERLLGVNENCSPNPPWVNCCLMSYYLDNQRPRESRRYRIFGTRFPG